MNVGDLVYFTEKPRTFFRVQAANDRFAVLSRPHFKTVLYCIVDHENQWRAPEDYIFGFGAETREQCEAMLARVTAGESGLSRRHGIELHVAKIKSTSTTSGTTTQGAE